MTEPGRTVDKLQRDWDQLYEQYLISREVWRDGKFAEFNNRYWTDLESSVQSMLQTSNEIAQAISASRCAFPDE